jgi:hypothetical protein
LFLFRDLLDFCPSPELASLSMPPSLLPISITDGLYFIYFITTAEALPSFLGSWSGSIDLSPSMLYKSFNYKFTPGYPELAILIK